MRAVRLALVAALGIPLAGCVVAARRTHVSAGVAVSAHCDHHFVFYPDYDAYHCGSCSHWWVHGGGTWVRYEHRPRHIVVAPTTVVVRVEERGREPWKHYDKHKRKGGDKVKGGRDRGGPFGRPR